MDIVDEILADRQAGTRRLVAEYANRLNETAVRLCGNVTDAEDYVFRTLERAVSRIHTFSRKCALSTWLYEILVNIIRDDARLKAANALTFTDNLPEIEDMRPDAGAALTEREEAALVRAAVRELPDAYRALVVFRYYNEMTVPEISQVMSLPEGTVKRRLHEAVNLMRAKISRTVLPETSSNNRDGDKQRT
jgi:RNA polymerase sigma-70 factor (ECF subfamily)